MPRTSERGGPRTRARIAEVAAGLFLERGFDAVTVADVARAAGVSTVTVFNHFPRKEDLFLDRSGEADELLRAAAAEQDVVEALRATALRLAEERHPLSGLNARSVPFFRTVAGSASLVARARELAADLQRALSDELVQTRRFEGDATLFAAFFVAGYSAVLVETARRRMDGADPSGDHLERLEHLFSALRDGFGGPSRGPAAPAS